MERSSKNESERLVRALYLGILRRPADDAGRTFWITQLENGLSPASVAETFIETQEFRDSPAAKLFVPPGHFYSPIVSRFDAERHLTSIETRSVPASLPGIAINRGEVVGLWNKLLPFLRTCPFPDLPGKGFRYAYDNPAYSYGDGAMLHAMLRMYRPKRLIEIGSGWSSACTLDTIEKNLDNNCEVTCIDPHTELLLNLIGEIPERVEIIESGVQEVPIEVFNRLVLNDVLFIDSSHVLRTGSDVCYALFEILPHLASGVLVHFHDMFWPFEYPREWVLDDNRSWNEIYAIRAFLTNNCSWQILMFNDYLAKMERSLIETTFPQFLHNAGGSLWLRRK